MGGVEITTLADRRELTPRMFDLAGVWPEFMRQDRIGDILLGRVNELFPEHCVVGTDQGEVVAVGRSVPFVFPEEGRRELPDGGWDQVLMWGISDQRRGRTPTVSSALEIVIRADHKGRGLSGKVLGALRDAVRAVGHPVLYAPVRPNGKTDPGMPMAEYAALTRADGLPVDPWLRVHARAGATIERIAQASMVISGSLAEWRRWTGLPFDADGEVTVPQALTPVHCSVRHDHAVYVEPNVWVRHDLTR